MATRLLLALILATHLAACGACEGHGSNSGSSGRCGLTIPW